MVDGEAIPDPVFAVFYMLIPNLVKPRAPLRVWVLEGCSAALGDIANNDLRVVVFKDPQETDQSRITSRLPCQAQATWG